MLTMSLVLPGGGPDYQAIGALQPEVQVVAEAPLLPPLVEIEGEVIVAYPDHDVLMAILDCEWRAPFREATTTGNGFWGRGQWTLATWRSTRAGKIWPYPHLAPIVDQLDAMREVRDRRGSYRDWPGCARRLGLS